MKGERKNGRKQEGIREREEGRRKEIINTSKS